MGVSENRGTPKSSILIRFSIIFTIHFGVFPPILGNIHIERNSGQVSYSKVYLSPQVHKGGRKQQQMSSPNEKNTTIEVSSYHFSGKLNLTVILPG